MRVEFIGGPKDGAVLDVPDGMRDFTFVVPVGGRAVWAEEDTGSRASDSKVPINTVSMPIERVGRRFVVRWPWGLT